jgi:hypothetical protein
MGIEYPLRCSAADAEAVAAVLRRLPAARETAPSSYRFELGLSSASAQDRPQATVEAGPGCVYFCDHCGGAGRALLGEVVARLVSTFGPITVEEL